MRVEADTMAAQEAGAIGRGTAGEAADGKAVLEELRRRIAEHEIAPGARLNELELSREFDLPRARVREILATLEQRGLVERIPNRGAIARRLEVDEIFAIYDVREVLEGLAVRCAVKNEPVATWEAYRERFGEAMRACIAAGEVERYEEAFVDLRHAVIVAARNPVLFQMLDSIQDQTRMIMRRVLVLPGRAESGRALAERMLEAMCAGDADGAERLRREAIRAAIDDLRRYHRFVL